MRIEKWKPKEFKKAYPGALGTHDFEEGEHIVRVPYGASTKTILHEIGHAKLGHTSRPKTFGEIADREISVDKYVYGVLGREPSFEEKVGDLVYQCRELYSRGWRPNDVLNFIKEAMRRNGYEMTKEEISDTWSYLNKCYEDYRSSK